MFGWENIIELNKIFEERMVYISKHTPDLPYNLIREVTLDMAGKSPRSVLEIPEYEILYDVIKRQHYDD